MSSIKGIIVGVSDYSCIGADDLPFCVNDIELVKKALTSGLRANCKDLITLGENSIVKYDEFVNELSNIVQMSSPNDTLIFYFSGHGMTKMTQHYLVLSDNIIRTSEIIRIIETTKAKNKIICNTKLLVLQSPGTS